MPDGGKAPDGSSRRRPAPARRRARARASRTAPAGDAALAVATALGPALRALDAVMVRANGLESLSPGVRGCGEQGLRFRARRLRRPVRLAGATLAPGAMVVDLHLCNERDPDAVTREGAARWATRLLVRYRRSCREIARRLRDDPELAEVEGVGGVTAIFGGAGGHGGAGRLPIHLGFEVLPHPAPLGAFGAFFQRLYAWGLLAAYAPGSLRGRRIGELGFIEVWMTRQAFLERFAPAERRRQPPARSTDGAPPSGAAGT